MKEITKIGLLTSGGDSPGMNAAIRSVVRTAKYYNREVIGIEYGYRGLIEEKFITLNSRNVQNIIHRGGTFLKSARCNEFRTKEGRAKAFQNLKKQNIKALIVIGGDGSFTGAKILEDEFNIRVVGIPGTIDNDIYGTDYTLGFDTAVNTVVNLIDKIRDTASSHDRLFFIEVMGRDSGYIAINSGIASGAEEILIPENNIGVEKLIKSLEHSSLSGKTSNIVIVTEGEREGGNIYEIADYIKKHKPKYDIRVTVLGHVQRGGSPTYFDRILASRMGVEAVETMLAGNSGVMIGIQNQKLINIPFDKAIKLHHDINLNLLRIAHILSL